MNPAPQVIHPERLPERPSWWEELGCPTGRGVRVAVLDSGWDRGIQEPRVLPGLALVDPDDELALLESPDDHDLNGHGTACSDLILRVAPDARVLPVRVFGRRLETSPSVLHAALDWAADQEVHVVNLSLGTTVRATRDALYLACERAKRNGQIVVAAARGFGGVSYPAIFDNTVGVAPGRFRSPFSFRYRPGHALECVARGFEQIARTVGGQELVHHGSSFAAPTVSGLVALFLERFPDTDLEGIRSLLARYAAVTDTACLL